MERLTELLFNGTYACISVCKDKCIEGKHSCYHCHPFANVICKLTSYENTNMNPDQISAMMAHNTALIEQLADYTDAEEKGLLVKLPCAVGSTVYRIEKFKRNPIVEMKVIHISVREKTLFLYCMAEDDHAASCYPDIKIGSLLFLNRSEAEREYKNMKERGEI